MSMTNAARKTNSSDADQIIDWIEDHCQRSDGRPARLTFAQRESIREIYSRGGPDAFAPLIVERELRTFLALVHICGPQARPGQPVPKALSGLPVFAILASAGPTLTNALIERKGGALVSPALGVRYPAAAV
jgi:hypothetical protein